MLSASSNDTSDPDSERYYQRKADQQCTKCGAAVGPDRQLCDRHVAAQAKADKASKARIRADRRAEGKCAGGCGRKSSTYWCSVCRAPRIDTTPASVYLASPARFHTAGFNGKSSWAWRTETDGRRRKRGTGRGHRGAPSRAETDAFDTRAGETEWALALQALAVYHSPENQALPRIQRDAALRAAIGHFELAGRIGDDLVERLRKRLR